MKKQSNSGVYAIINFTNSKMYIGSSKNLKTRKYQHFSGLRSNRHDNYHLQQSFNKHGENNFEFKILEYCNENKLLEREQYFINTYNSTNPFCGYNLSLKANKIGFTDEIKEKIRQANLGKKMSEETKEKLRVFNTGKKHSIETKELCRKASLGIKRTEEQKEFLRKRNIGKKQSRKTINKARYSRMKYKQYCQDWIKLYKQGYSYYKIAKIYNISHRTISRYINLYSTFLENSPPL